jgi:hypothetical protein
MNITIILPAVQIVKRDDSPQPTTPFPPVSITPSPSPYNPRTPFSPADFHENFNDHRHYYPQSPSSRELTKSRADLAARQAAYDYENEEFDSPSPTPPPQPPPEEKKSGLPRPLVRQKAIQQFESIDRNDEDMSDVSQNPSVTQTTTESPSSADTVRTAVYKDSASTTNAGKDKTNLVTMETRYIIIIKEITTTLVE